LSNNESNFAQLFRQQSPVQTFPWRTSAVISV